MGWVLGTQLQDTNPAPQDDVYAQRCPHPPVHLGQAAGCRVKSGTEK